MKRREFIGLLSGTAVAWPFVANAQQPSKPVIGFLSSTSAASYESPLRAFHQGLSETGYAEGHNAIVEYRWADDHNERLPALAADLIRRQVAVIVATGPAGVQAKMLTSTIPIVFSVAADPVALGLVDSLNRPGGNVTGVTSLGNELGPKRLELLHELVPAATGIAVLLDPTTVSFERNSRELTAAAHKLGWQANIVRASNDREIDQAFARLLELRVGALAIATSLLFTSSSERLGAVALRHRVPAVFQTREFAAAGGLVSYGASRADLSRLVGIYTGRILKGEKPADLPVQQATKVELVINLKTANALRLTVPLSLRGRADEVIE